jgi:hypothetical protein
MTTEYTDLRAFKIDVAADVLSDLPQRLKSTRWSYQIGRDK